MSSDLPRTAILVTAFEGREALTFETQVTKQKIKDDRGKE